jgi:hypothetical protein
MKTNKNIPSIKLPEPADSIEFFEAIKKIANDYWSDKEISKDVYGFQIQKGTKWKNGLSDLEIAKFEDEIGFKFPTALRNFYKTMNGIDKKGINVYGNSGENFAYQPIYYSYPEDLDIIKEYITWIYEENKVNYDQLLQENISRIFPVCGHRFVLVDGTENYVLSMYGDDVIFWADNISKLVATDIFKNIDNMIDYKSNPNDVAVKFWIKDE